MARPGHAALKREEHVPIAVNHSNFVRAESDLHFGRYVTRGAFGTFFHERAMTPIDKQEIVRINRDTLNNLTATPNPDGSFTVQFGGCQQGTVNCLPFMSGWNYTVRLYRARKPLMDGSWQFAEALPVK